MCVKDCVFAAGLFFTRAGPELLIHSESPFTTDSLSRINVNDLMRPRSDCVLDVVGQTCRVMNEAQTPAFRVSFVLKNMYNKYNLGKIGFSGFTTLDMNVLSLHSI